MMRLTDYEMMQVTGGKSHCRCYKGETLTTKMYHYTDSCGDWCCKDYGGARWEHDRHGKVLGGACSAWTPTGDRNNLWRDIFKKAAEIGVNIAIEEIADIING